MKRLIILALILAAIGVAAWFWFSPTAPEKGRNGTVPVSVVKAYREAIYDSVEALGTTYANESITVTATASETISEINFSDGQAVKKGAVIARLEQREEMAQLAAAKAQLEEHKRELERVSMLLQNKAASQRDYDERQTLMKIAQKDIDGIQARIEDRTLRAPFDGTLGIRRLSMGALVQPGDVITTIDDTKTIKLDFTVPSIHLATLKPGVAIEGRAEALGERAFSGQIESVDTRVDPVTRAVLVRAILPNADGAIRPGLLMRVILLKDARNALIVPEESVLQRQDRHFVLIVHPETNKVEERQITIGTRRPGIVEVLSGVKEGELIIVRGVNRVENGGTVTIKETWDKIRPPGANESTADVPSTEPVKRP